MNMALLESILGSMISFICMHADSCGAMKDKICLVAVIITALTFSVPTTHGQEECPQGASFIVSFDSVIPLADLQNVPDPNLTFFRNVLRFTEQEIQTAMQSAIEYFNTTFGLDFSNSEPNQQGQRIFQNTSFGGEQIPFTATAKANHWLANGNTRSRCFDARIGWFGVRFLGEQVLHGTYGGTEGRRVTGPSTASLLNWLYLWINTCPQSPVIIQQRSTAPASTTPDGISLDPTAASHPILGNGMALCTLFINSLPPDQRLARVVYYASVSFPGDPIP